jgi:hypothetical protein
VPGRDAIDCARLLFVLHLGGAAENVLTFVDET